MGPQDEVALIASRFRQFSAEYDRLGDKPNAADTWARGIRLQDDAGQLLIRAFHLDCLPEFEKLPALVQSVESPPPRRVGQPVVIVASAANLFTEFCGFNTILAKPDTDGIFQVVRGEHGGILPTSFPQTLPPWPASPQGTEVDHYKHHAMVCDWLAKRIEAASQRAIETEPLDKAAAGVALFDVACAIEGDDAVAVATVKRWSDSKKLSAKPIGKCPLDGRKSLYRLSEILADVAKILSLSQSEVNKYRQALTVKLRHPATD